MLIAEHSHDYRGGSDVMNAVFQNEKSRLADPALLDFIITQFLPQPAFATGHIRTAGYGRLALEEGGVVQPRYITSYRIIA